MNAESTTRAPVSSAANRSEVKRLSRAPVDVRPRRTGRARI